ncbi:MAG: hypothetical protein V7646_1408 [Pseudonocardia sp.]
MIFGLALFGVLLVVIAITADTDTAVGVLIFVAVAFGCLAAIGRASSSQSQAGSIRRRALDIRLRWSLVFVLVVRALNVP